MNFDFPEDEKFFKERLCSEGEDLSLYAHLFDIRPEAVKRQEFDRIKTGIKQELIRRFGEVCMLQYSSQCNAAEVLVIDHVIPLSSNVLNKKRGMQRVGASKVITQSIGSNDPRNLILVCKKCNSDKFNKFLTKEQYSRIFSFTR